MFRSQKSIISLLAILLLCDNGFSMNCSSAGSISSFGGHYYAITSSTLTYADALKAAVDDGGYLAVPDSSAENNYIKELVGGGTLAWIGVYDVNNMQNYCISGSDCVIDTSRFQTVLGGAPTFTYWGANQPDNLVDSVDVLNGTAMVEPLGEHWTVINGNNGYWSDEGNHADRNNNPVRYRAVIEFDTAPSCYVTSDPGSSLPTTGKFCNTSLYDSSSEIVTQGKTYQCLQDQYTNYYCPYGLAPATAQWDYKDGTSQQETGIDYTSMICNGTMINGQCVDTIENASYVTNLTCQTKSIACAPGADSCCHIDISCGSNSATVKYYDCCNPQSSLKKSVNVNDANAFLSGVYYQPYSGSQGKIICNSAGACSIYFQDAYCGGSAIGSPYLTNTFALNTSGEYICSDTGYVNGGSLSADPTKCYHTKPLECPSGYTPTGSSDPTQACSQTYTYYNYLCSGTTPQDGVYMPQITSGSSPISPTNNCKGQGYTCNEADVQPALVAGQWECSPFPCVGNSNMSPNGSVGVNDKNNNGWANDGSCSGTIRIFNGKGYGCRSWDLLQGLDGGGCCDESKVFGGLVSCTSNEKNLAGYRKNSECHYIGNYCSKEVNLLVGSMCVEKSDSYCCFNSELARIIEEQGRPQIGKGWGSADNPDCSGFTAAEFQMLDLSKMDLSEFISSIKTPDAAALKSSIQQNITSVLQSRGVGQ